MDKQYLAGGLSCVVFIPLTAAMISTDTHIFWAPTKPPISSQWR